MLYNKQLSTSASLRKLLVSIDTNHLHVTRKYREYADDNPFDDHNPYSGKDPVDWVHALPSDVSALFGGRSFLKVTSPIKSSPDGTTFWIQVGDTASYHGDYLYGDDRLSFFIVLTNELKVFSK